RSHRRCVGLPLRSAGPGTASRPHHGTHTRASAWSVRIAGAPPAAGCVMASAPGVAHDVLVTPWRGLDGRDRLEAWRANIGNAVALDSAPSTPPRAGDLAILSWNLWIGRGRLLEVVARVRAITSAPLIVLAQEAFRMDASVPHRPSVRRAAGGFPPRGVPRED